MKIEKLKKSELVVQVRDMWGQNDGLRVRVRELGDKLAQAHDCLLNSEKRTSSRKRFGAACGALGFSLGAFLTILVLWLLA